MTTPAARAREIRVFIMDKLARNALGEDGHLDHPFPAIDAHIEREITRAAADAFERAAKEVEGMYATQESYWTVEVGHAKSDAAAAIRALATQEAPRDV